MLDAGLGLLVTFGLAVVLLAVHEFGHYVVAAGVGIPRDEMRVHLISLPARVEFVRADDFSEVEQFIPNSSRGLTGSQSMFTIAAAGHLAELVTAGVLTAVGFALGFGEVPARFTLLSIFITVSYLIVGLLSAVVLDEPFGDPVEMWWRSIPGTVLLYGVFFTTMSGFVWLLAVPGDTIRSFGLIVPLVFIPLAMLAAKHQ